MDETQKPTEVTEPTEPPEEPVAKPEVHNYQQEIPTQKDSRMKRFFAFFKTRKGKITLLIIVVVLVLGILGWAIYHRYFASGGQTIISSIIKPKATPTETKIISPLDGTLSSPDTAKRHPLAVMIENHTEARPQVGLNEASIVYEAIAEGGITRFMAVFGPRAPEKIGPVRSARTYYVDWAEEFDAFYAHVGGAANALSKIKSDGVLDLDQFANSSAYWREPKAGVATEHTMFADPAKLWEIASQKGWKPSENFENFEFKEEAKKADRPTESKLVINFSSAQYQVSYTYDPTENVYLRSQAGSPHKDGITGTQIKPKNVIVQICERNLVESGGKSVYDMKTTGEGKATVYLDGKKIPATWKKTSKTSRTFFYDSSGNKIKLNAGQTWIEVVPPDVSVTDS